MECFYCGAKIYDQGEACDLGWIPDFWRGDRRVNWPVCPVCVQEHCKVDADGEMVETVK